MYCWRRSYTRAANTIIFETNRYGKHFSGTKLRESFTLLKTYSGKRLKVVGETNVKSGQKANCSGWIWPQEEVAPIDEFRLAFNKSDKDGCINYVPFGQVSDVFTEKLGILKSFNVISA